MAKVRCARCGDIFGLQQSEIQTCPRCGCRMKVNRPAQPAPRPASPTASDEYDVLRKEYMEMMRSKLAAGKADKGDGVYLSKDEYNALMERQPEQQIPADDAAAKTEGPAPARSSAYEPYGAQAPADDAASLGYYSDSADELYENEPARAPATNRKEPVFNWLAFLFALAAGVLSALLLIFDVFRELSGFTGMDILFPDGGWTNLNLPINPLISIVFFLPAVLAVLMFISVIRKGKGSKFILALLYLVAGAALAILPIVYDWTLFTFNELSFDLILDCIVTDSSVMVLLAAGVCIATFIMALIAGILTRSRHSVMNEIGDLDEEDAA